MKAGLDAVFEGLTINLSGASANGFLANTSAGASYNISALGGGNSITTASTTTPAVSIESTGTGSPFLDMTFQSISAGVPSGGNNSLVFGAGATGSFTVLPCWAKLISGPRVRHGPSETHTSGGREGGQMGVLVPPVPVPGSIVVPPYLFPKPSICSVGFGRCSGGIRG